jgi:hypothetical protein
MAFLRKTVPVFKDQMRIEPKKTIYRKKVMKNNNAIGTRKRIFSWRTGSDQKEEGALGVHQQRGTCLRPSSWYIMPKF